jgi:hypothetical protein
MGEKKKVKNIPEDFSTVFVEYRIYAHNNIRYGTLFLMKPALHVPTLSKSRKTILKIY